MTFRSICTDIDGTLLNSSKQLSESTINAFHKVPANIPVILASSRMPSAMTHLQRELGIGGRPLISYNGGYVIQYSPDGSTVIYDSVFIPVEVCDSVISMASGSDVHLSLYFEDNWYAPKWTIGQKGKRRLQK